PCRHLGRLTREDARPAQGRDRAHAAPPAELHSRGSCSAHRSRCAPPPAGRAGHGSRRARRRSWWRAARTHPHRHAPARHGQPRTDPALRDQVVMSGGHLDSWHAATVATDNAEGAAVVLEVARILKTIGVRPRRTIRIALWSGEEEGLLGSRAWVQQHLAGDANREARDKFSVYFNIDPGFGKSYGWYSEGK